MPLPKIAGFILILFVVSLSGCRGLACQPDCFTECLAFEQFIDDMIDIIKSEEE